MKKLLALILTLIVTNSHAGNTSYSCIVKYAGEVSNAGDMDYATNVHKGKNGMLSSYIGTTFTVDRNTGAVIGEIVSNQSANAIKTEILSNGSGGNAFRLLTRFGPNPSILYLQINDYPAYKNGNESPFIGFRWSESISGSCK